MTLKKNRRQKRKNLQKTETVGDIFLQLEVLLDKLIDKHGFQWGDLIWWMFGHLNIHRKDAQETEVKTGRHPNLKYEFED